MAHKHDIETALNDLSDGIEFELKHTLPEVIKKLNEAEIMKLKSSLRTCSMNGWSAAQSIIVNNRSFISEGLITKEFEK